MQDTFIGIIGGSGLYQMAGVEIREERRVTTPYGAPSDAILLGTLDGIAVAFLPRHGRHHAISPSEINYRANIWALKSLGVENVISVSAVGSLKEEIVPGHLVLIDQFIDRTRQRASTFFHDGCVAHVSFADPICLQLMHVLYEARAAVETTVHRGGTYVCMEGPMYSTRAESHLYRSWGADVIGMTNLQEAKLAREAEISYASIALSTDYDCWRAHDEACDTASILAVIKANVHNAQQLIRAALPRVAAGAQDAPAKSALANAIITHPAQIPAATKARLAPILKKYVPLD